MDSTHAGWSDLGCSRLSLTTNLEAFLVRYGGLFSPPTGSILPLSGPKGPLTLARPGRFSCGILTFEF